MFRKRRRRADYERGRRIAAAVSAYMDRQEEYAWARWQRAEEVGDEAASSEFPPLSVVGAVEELLPLCENNPDFLMEALEVWWESRQARYKEEGNEDRADIVSGMYLSVGLEGIGNLFGFISADAPAFDPKLAEAGRERGWRT